MASISVQKSSGLLSYSGKLKSDRLPFLLYILKGYLPSVWINSLFNKRVTHPSQGFLNDNTRKLPPHHTQKNLNNKAELSSSSHPENLCQGLRTFLFVTTKERPGLHWVKAMDATEHFRILKELSAPNTKTDQDEKSCPSETLNKTTESYIKTDD